MRLLDEKGRLLGRVSIIDLAILAIALAGGALTYRFLAQPARIAPPFPLESRQAWVAAGLYIPPERAWLAGAIPLHAAERDPRSGEPIAEITGVRPHDSGGLVVAVRLRAVYDSQQRLVYGPELLVPGRELAIRTEQCHLSGHIMSVEPEKRGE